MSLSLASGASAAVGPVSDIPFEDTATGPGLTLSEDEISGVSLGTFYVFDKENVGKPTSSARASSEGDTSKPSALRGLEIDD
jgi:hypothetical protein